METMKVIQTRCSLKSQLSEKPIEPEKLKQVLDAACLAPSARNMQPWRFVVVEGQKQIEAFVAAAVPEVNAMIKQAPVIVVACARPGDDVAHDGKEYYLYDVGMAMENLVLAATDLGLVTHMMTNFNEAEIRKILKIPEEVRVVVITPLAYPKAGSYAESSKERLGQRTRKPFGEVAYFGQWQEQEPA